MHRLHLRALAAVAAVVCVAAGPLAFAGTSTSPHLSVLDAARATVARARAALPGAAGAAPALGVDHRCIDAPRRIDPQPDAQGHPTNPAWIERDQLNQYCALTRIRDQVTSPAFIRANGDVGRALYLDQLQEQVADGPGHVHGGLTTLIPGALAADPFRDIARWTRLTGGRVERVRFTALDGAQLRGHLWLPPTSEPEPADGYPGIVITDGSVQAYENLYYWAAEGLAQYGYEVLTFDVQGQGDSDLLPAQCAPGDCPGVPYQQSYNFYQGTEDALNWFLSPRNPGRDVLDRHRVGIAGHSLGASAVSWVGQCDRRVRAVVAWDDLVPVSPQQCARNVTIPRRDRADRLHAPALATTNDYEFNVQPATTVPDPHGGSNTGGLDGDAGYRSLAKAGIDSELVSFRNGTHLTYTYIDYLLPSDELSERFAFHYTLAWFDRYLRGGRDPYTPVPAYRRLTSLGRYDASADRNGTGPVSIGAGVFDPQAAAADPTDDAAGNVPYRIAGIPVRNSLSFYYYSQYRLHDPDGVVRTCTDMLARCPRKAPPTP